MSIEKQDKSPNISLDYIFNQQRHWLKLCTLLVLEDLIFIKKSLVYILLVYYCIKVLLAAQTDFSVFFLQRFGRPHYLPHFFPWIFILILICLK